MLLEKVLTKKLYVLIQAVSPLYQKVFSDNPNWQMACLSIHLQINNMIQDIDSVAGVVGKVGLK